MKYLFTILLLTLSVLGFSQNDSIGSLFEVEKTDTLNLDSIKNKYFVLVEQMPSWKGCENDKKISSCNTLKLMKYLMANQNYPYYARENNIEGTVYLSYVINPTGNIVDVTILKSASEDLDKEAKELISNMPSWNPGKQKGKAVNVRLTQAIRFVLN